LEDRQCAVCHDREDLGGTTPQIVDMVMEQPGGGRALSVVAPIVNQPSCRSAACHVHAEDRPFWVS